MSIDDTNGMAEIWRRRAAARIAADVHRRIIRESRSGPDAAATLDEVVAILEFDRRHVARPSAPELQEETTRTFRPNGIGADGHQDYVHISAPEMTT